MSEQPQRKTRSLYQRYRKMSPTCELCDKRFCPCHVRAVRVDEVHINLRLWLCVDCARSFCNPHYELAQAWAQFPVMLPDNTVVQDYPLYLVALRLKRGVCCKVGECPTM